MTKAIRKAEKWTCIAYSLNAVAFVVFAVATFVMAWLLLTMYSTTNGIILIAYLCIFHRGKSDIRVYVYATIPCSRQQLLAAFSTLDGRKWINGFAGNDCCLLLWFTAIESVALHTSSTRFRIAAAGVRQPFNGQELRTANKEWRIVCNAVLFNVRDTRIYMYDRARVHI